MRILDKYLAKEFLRFYFIFILFFIAIFILTDFFTSMSRFKMGVEFVFLINYYFLQIPYLWILLSPVSIVISCLFTIVYLEGTNQIQAVQTSGTSIKRTLLPIFTCGLIISFSMLFLDNTLTFQTNQLSYELKQRNFIGIAKEKIQKNTFIAVPPSYIFYIRSFNLEKAEMRDILIYKKSFPPSLTTVKEGKWEKGKWVFYQGREYLLGEELKEIYFHQKSFDIDQKPDYFTKKYFPPEQMNTSELKKYLENYKKSGFKTLDLETELNFKYSSPFANFILIFMSISLGIFLKKRGRGAGFALGLIISFGYYETMAFFKAMGKSGTVIPGIAAWIPNLIFLAVGIYLVTRME
ncbi:YjgP/YjgQ family permease [Patescibacteria group bacterium]|nr:YjgP/YjgQ family permease [Patescibacteria group bacterium]